MMPHDRISSTENDVTVKQRDDAVRIIKEFGVAPGGKPYFQEFKDDLQRMQAETDANSAQAASLH
jgi:CHASE3 domain sensor protein